MSSSEEGSAEESAIQTELAHSVSPQQNENCQAETRLKRFLNKLEREE